MFWFQIFFFFLEWLSLYLDKVTQNKSYLNEMAFIWFSDKARVRVQISAAHSEEDINQAVEAFQSVAAEIGILWLNRKEVFCIWQLNWGFFLG